MKIISELANSSIKNNKKDTFATRVSILLAVILLGTIVFILSDLRQSQIKYLKNTVGDYEVSLSEIDKQTYDILEKNKDIEKVHYDKIISTDIGLIIYEKSKYFLENIDTHLIDGRNPKNSREIVVTKQFLNKNRNYKIASNIKINEKNYKIVGVYEDFSFSFEDPVAFSYFDDSKGLDFKKGESYFAYIWYKNPRDTYTNTRKILKELNINEKKALDKGQLFYNASFLESKMIFPKGIIPPKRVVNSFIESFGLFFILILLFAVMIYGSFNVYNNRDIKELALLKSSGMTEKQTKKLVKLKAFKISIFPILVGTLLSYLNAIFLTYLMYINNRISYKNMSKILSDNLEMSGFKFYTPDIKSIFIILFFSLLMVYISAIVPARKSSKINIVEGLNGLDPKNKKQGKSKIKGSIEKTLAKDYFKTYKNTYKVISIAILLSAIAMNVLLVSVSYRNMNAKYNKFDDPYNFEAYLFSDSRLNKNMVDDLKNINFVDEIHIFEEKDFKFYKSDNKNFLSNKFENDLENKSQSEDYFVRILALSKEDFNKIKKENNLTEESNFLLLNKTPKNNFTPYKFRKYIPLTDSKNNTINLRYYDGGKIININNLSNIKKFPYDLEEHLGLGIYIITNENSFDEFIKKYGNDPANPANKFIVKIKAKKNLKDVSEDAIKIITSYFQKSDYSIFSDITRKAIDSEQSRNENLLSFGIQIIFLIIALSNAYNSFHGNLRARKKEFNLLSTAGMTDLQIRKMINNELKFLITRILAIYAFVFALSVFARAKRSPYEVNFAIREILININYLPLLFIFIVTIIGLLLAQKSGMRELSRDNIIDNLK